MQNQTEPPLDVICNVGRGKAKLKKMCLKIGIKVENCGITTM